MGMQECRWRYESDEFSEVYETECGQTYMWECGTLKENGYVYCPHCGRLILDVTGEENGNRGVQED